MKSIIAAAFLSVAFVGCGAHHHKDGCCGKEQCDKATQCDPKTCSDCKKLGCTKDHCKCKDKKDAAKAAVKAAPAPAAKK